MPRRRNARRETPQPEGKGSRQVARRSRAARWVKRGKAWVEDNWFALLIFYFMVIQPALSWIWPKVKPFFSRYVSTAPSW